MGKYLDKQGVETLWNKTKALNGQKQDRTSAELDTEAKSIVEAINEVNGKASAGLRLLGTISPGDPAPAAEQSADGYYLATQPGRYFNGIHLHKTHIGIVTQQDGRWIIEFVRTAPLPKPRVIAWRAIPLGTARPGDIYIISHHPWLKGALPNGQVISLAKSITATSGGLFSLTIPDDWGLRDLDSAIQYIRDSITPLRSFPKLSSPYLQFLTRPGVPDPMQIISTHPPFALIENPLVDEEKASPTVIDWRKMMITCHGNAPGNPHRLRKIGSMNTIWKMSATSDDGRLRRRKYFAVRRAKAIIRRIKSKDGYTYAVKYIHKSSVLANYMRFGKKYNPVKKMDNRYEGVVRV